MKKFFSLALLLLGTMQSPAVEWLTDVPEAMIKAKAENKAVLLDFTGSDWCIWCKRLKAEILDQPEFTSFAEENLILVEVDFPMQKFQSNERRQANARLSQQFGIQGYPTVIILDKEGTARGKLGYVRGGPKAFLGELAKVPVIAWRTSKPVSDDGKGTVKTSPPSAPTQKEILRPAYAVQYDGLFLKGILGGAKKMALVNDRSFCQGEKGKLTLGEKTIQVECKEIRADSVLLQVEGEKEPRQLKLNN